MPLSEKHILLGISGGIAAYKSPDIVRRLRENGAKVRVVMTEAAKYFITPLTLQAVSGHPVSDHLFDPAAESAMGHIQLSKWADLLIIAPATADFLARVAVGMANDLLTTLCLSAPVPVVVLPSMNQQMYRAKATQTNLKILAKRGILLWGPDSGDQACGDNGPGRMLEPRDIVALVKNHFSTQKDGHGLRIMITAGPTREAFDPVRFISNQSSGKMGFAIAKAAAQLGAQVTLISGSVSLETPARVHRINVISALEMQKNVRDQAHLQDIFIACAAVADYRPQVCSEQKMKQHKDKISLEMVKNPDIVSEVAHMTQNRPFVVGFAAETHDMKKYARQKLIQKNLDLICANDVSLSDQGFDADRNALHLFWENGEKTLPLEDKNILAQLLIKEVLTRYDEKN
ncbi:bifunctional phosphopantothenoylcysteine decarboxylase/phosphopantothenate--cysteine ligase CoaBC [Candidatus Williamhamiltonella defendens]|uniref:Coenzyme A biosynthesis bifunctional protein CoaBC n=1 Tax=Candidatus Hamiltonella defensa (Bemisia tabaci) TaxID=672795 RepID=A0A249DXA5_9ENTR|nr:bifunctional phosphopantothenoylcysteine decarboxylase/phosphopantothenate--cysteine ligase CoaBC [Candidatus Hamiltonella defensa]ASX26168.1 bifunctional phosphopantothenoylcysteine decarboxylase/phosphopantothenate synthase [Candidatus Hamiltonella defensa (Bemisia tabaci)]CED78777.1 bifunctional protein (Includes: 4'-phosphopantothenoylcysteine decarboxylase; phosphopantothenoylcysteine synthetase, FMN-binding) [Candidatus Hamiltonella defensa (Bemisia tabaci)]